MLSLCVTQTEAKVGVVQVTMNVNNYNECVDVITGVMWESRRTPQAPESSDNVSCELR